MTSSGRVNVKKASFAAPQAALYAEMGNFLKVGEASPVLMRAFVLGVNRGGGGEFRGGEFRVNTHCVLLEVSFLGSLTLAHNHDNLMTIRLSSQNCHICQKNRLAPATQLPAMWVR